VIRGFFLFVEIFGTTTSPASANVKYDTQYSRGCPPGPFVARPGSGVYTLLKAGMGQAQSTLRVSRWMAEIETKHGSLEKPRSHHLQDNRSVTAHLDKIAMAGNCP